MRPAIKGTPREERLLKLDKLARELRDVTEKYDYEVSRIMYEIIKLHPDYPNSGIGGGGVQASKDLDSVGNIQIVSSKLSMASTNLDRLLMSIEKEY
jgi:hypothetical protein